MKKGEIRYASDMDDVKILEVAGYFTKDTTPDLQRVCYQLSDDENVRAVLIDFESVTHIDSSAFACMINFIRDHAKKDVAIGVVNLRYQDQALMDILKINPIINTYQDRAEAVSALSKQ
ncbi:STAS domain-containing protein [Candidatus Omnitrophota bacterium]